MQTIYVNKDNIPCIDFSICAAIGNFDGVHLGHQVLINKSKTFGYKSAVVTFYPHPSTVLKNISNYPLLTPIEQKKKIIQDLNIDYLFIIEFNQNTAKISIDDFINMLKKLNIKSIVCGYDFSFGYLGLGTIRDLESNFEVHEVKKYVYDDIRVSSTYIRELLSSGEVKNASLLLGRYYLISGEVIHGNELGRTIGFPTANINYKNYYLPKNGVYYVKVIIDNKTLDGMCNIGNNPTFNFTEEKRLEVNIFDFDQLIYGKTIDILFIDRIRGERKLNNKEELTKQLMVDKKTCFEIKDIF